MGEIGLVEVVEVLYGVWLFILLIVVCGEEGVGLYG